MAKDERGRGGRGRSARSDRTNENVKESERGQSTDPERDRMRHDVPEREYGVGYGGGYGRSGDYGERGGRGRWGGEDAGAPSDHDRARFADESSDYGGYGASSGYPNRGREERPRERNDAGATYGSGGGAGWGTTGAHGAGRGYGGQGERWRDEPNFAGRGPRNYRRSDERIEDEVNEALTRHPRLDATDIEVRVHDGEVTLTGRVDSRDAKRMADDAADSVFGVVDVVNQLRIGREGARAPTTADREMARKATSEGGGVTSRQADGESGPSAAPASRAGKPSRGNTAGRRIRS